MTSERDQRYVRHLAAAALLSAVLVVPAEAQMPAEAALAPEFPTETAAIVAATSDLFDTIEARTAPRAAQPSISAPVLATPASAGAGTAKTEALTGRGEIRHLTGYRITWYPTERFLGSVDFMGTWDGNRNLVCGYVTWDLSDPESPVLDDIQATFLDVPDLSRETGEEVHAALLDANCAYGAIDANYAFFE